jgi:OOP family OmpA-OmpF porin
MASMMDGVQEFLTPNFLSHVSHETGESEAAVSKGFMAVVPTLLASIAGRSSDSGFMSQLASLAMNSPSDADALARSTKAITGSGVETNAGGWLSGLTGGTSSVTNAISRYAGVRASSASSLLSFGVPLVLGYLGRMMRSDHLDASKLAQRFQSERGTIASALPAGFNAFLPTGWLPGVSSRAAVDDVVTRRDVIDTAVQREKPRSRWLPAALIALALGGLLWWLARDRTVRPEGINTAVSNAAGTVNSAVRTMTRSLPGGVRIDIPAGGMEDRLAGYLAAPTASGGSFDFDRLEFETGSANLTSASRAQIASVAAILKAYPRAQIAIAGHTDNTGDEAANVELSRGRAQAVMDALRNSGVPAANMQAQGYGSSSPIADNASDAGRARNRRVTLSVTS